MNSVIAEAYCGAIQIRSELGECTALTTAAIFVLPPITAQKKASRTEKQSLTIPFRVFNL
jgi:hypothetical protein